MINEVFVILQHIPLLCDYKVWIDTVRGPEVISYLYSMAQLNMMEEDFYAHRMEEHKHASYFAMREEEREQKHEKARRTKISFC
jgi:hypothetical protein